MSNLSQYQRVWEQIKANTSPDLWITVTCQNKYMIQTVINMVQNTKSRENVSRKRLDLPSWGKLEIRRDEAKCQVHFRLKNAGAQL